MKWNLVAIRGYEYVIYDWSRQCYAKVTPCPENLKDLLHDTSSIGFTGLLGHATKFNYLQMNQCGIIIRREFKRSICGIQLPQNNYIVREMDTNIKTRNALFIAL